MTCVFFGNRQSPERVKIPLKTVVDDLIANKGVYKFYVGNNGRFDLYVQNLLHEISKSNHKIDFAIVLSKLGESAISGFLEDTVFPESLELSLPKFAISKRNEWMLKESKIEESTKK